MCHQSRIFRLGFVFGLGLLCCAMRLSALSQLPADPRTPAFGQAPPSAAAWPSPYAGQPDAILAGGKLFRRHCAECHGSDAEGSERAPSLRASPVQAAAPGVLFRFLTNGNLKHGMPSWSRLPDQRRWQLVSYVKSLGPIR